MRSFEEAVIFFYVNTENRRESKLKTAKRRHKQKACARVIHMSVLDSNSIRARMNKSV